MLYITELNHTRNRVGVRLHKCHVIVLTI